MLCGVGCGSWETVLPVLRMVLRPARSTRRCGGGSV